LLIICIVIVIDRFLHLRRQSILVTDGAHPLILARNVLHHVKILRKIARTRYCREILFQRRTHIANISSQIAHTGLEWTRMIWTNPAPLWISEEKMHFPRFFIIFLLKESV